jgi:hypothetical protein
VIANRRISLDVTKKISQGEIMNSRVLLLWMAVMSTTAYGQVIRCTDAATGKVTYSDRQCDTGSTGALVERKKTAEEIKTQRLIAAEANERKYLNQIREMEARQRAEAAAPAPMPVQQPVPDKSSSYECRRAQRDHETVSSIVSGTDELRRNRINASTMNVNAACGLQTELIQPPTVIVNNISRKQPVTISRCDSGFCYDNQGGAYRRNGPDYLLGPSGNTCHRSGAYWTCQ